MDIRTRKYKEKESVHIALEQYREKAKRHTLALECNCGEAGKRYLFQLCAQLQIAGNRLVEAMEKQLESMFSTEEYRFIGKLLTRYAKAAELTRAEEKDHNKLKLRTWEIAKSFDLSWKSCHSTMRKICGDMAKEEDSCKIPSVFAKTTALEVWAKVVNAMLAGVEKPKIAGIAQLPVLRAEQSNSAILLKLGENDRLYVELNKWSFDVFAGSKYRERELEAVVGYMKDPAYYDDLAMEKFVTTGELIDTFRPCSGAILCREIRGNQRVFLHITVEGKALPKDA